MTDHLEPELTDDEAISKEREELHGLLNSIGFSPLTPDDSSVQPEPFENIRALIAKRQQPADITQRRSGGRYISWLAAAAVVTVFAVLTTTLFDRPVAEAATPPILDFEYANANNIAYAPGQSAGEILQELAQTASTIKATTPAADANQIITIDAWYAQFDEAEVHVVPQTVTNTLRPDGSLSTQETRGEPLSADGRGLRYEPQPPEQTTTVETTEADTFDPSFAAKLATTPENARQQILDYAQCAGTDDEIAWCLVREISILWTTHVIPPRAAAAMWSILAEEPSIVSLGVVSDRAERPGIGFAINAPDDQYRSILIVSPETGRLLGFEDILIQASSDINVDVPAITAFTAIMDSRYK